MRHKLRLFNLILIVVFIISFTACTIPKTAAETTTSDTGQKDNISELEKSICSFALKFDKSMNVISSDSSAAGLAMRSSEMQITQANFNIIKNCIGNNFYIYELTNASLFIDLAIGDFLLVQSASTPPDSFFEPISEDGYINVPKGGGCPLGATTYIRFLTEEEKEIILEFIKSLGAETIPYDILSLPPSDQKSIISVISQKLTPENRELIKASYWNKEIWGTEGGAGLKALQQDVKSIMDYYFWSNAPEIESIITKGIESKLSNIGSQPIIDAFNESDKIGWIGYPPAEEKDQISIMEIKADFSGNVTGTVNEKRNFSLDLNGEPEFGTITGEGELSVSDPAIGENVKFEAKLEWTKWDEMGKPIEGLVILENKEKGYRIEITTKTDGTKEGVFFENGKQVGSVNVNIEGHTTYLNIETGSQSSLET